MQALASYSAAETKVQRELSSQRSLLTQQKQWDKELSDAEAKIGKAVEDAKSDKEVRCPGA